MDLFVEYIDDDFAVCRLPDRDKNLIRLPLKSLPSGIKPFKIITLRDNGSMFLNEYAVELRMKRISNELKYQKYMFSLKNS